MSAPEVPLGEEQDRRQCIQRALAQTGGNISAAARSLGISRPTLYSWMKRLHISRPARCAAS